MTAQEIMLVDISVPSSSMSVAEQGVLAELDRVNEELDRYTSKAEKEDYAFAIASGIVAGAVDSLYVGETHLFGEGTQQTATKASEQITANRRMVPQSLSLDLTKLVPKDAMPHVNKAMELAKNLGVQTGSLDTVARDQLVELAKRPSYLGFICAISLKLFDVGTQTAKKNSSTPLSMEVSVTHMQEMFVPAAIAGLMSWMLTVSRQDGGSNADGDLPKPILALFQLASQKNEVKQLATCTEKWFSKQVKEMMRQNKKGKARADVPSMLISLLGAYAALPMFQETDFQKYLVLIDGQKGLHKTFDGLPISALDRQAIPVLLNEVIVRMGYFVMRFARQFGATGNAREIDWANVVPFNNRTIDRMLTVSSMTLSMADMADAAVRASMESAGDWVLFSQKFVARYNVVATGRVAVAIVREASNEAREVALLREKRKLMEAKVAFSIDRLREYQAMLEERVDAYLAEDLQAFFEGFAMMDRGLMEGDSDLVIGGNVVIQRVLGREPQFSNQEEFDALMDSDEDFVF